MGKHDKKEQTTFSWQPMPDEFYKARIKALEKETLKLGKENDQLNRVTDVFIKQLDPENGDYVTRIEFEELEEEYEALHEKYIAELRLNEELKDALVRAALREV